MIYVGLSWNKLYKKLKNCIKRLVGQAVHEFDQLLQNMLNFDLRVPVPL